MISVGNSITISHLSGRFENCISLGYYCGTASVLSKLGLRSTSGPFDWYFSQLWAVVENIDNDFRDYFKKENLLSMEENPTLFMDTKYNFYYIHDVNNNLEDEYETIHSKYKHRITAFLEMIKSPTVFFRCVSDNSEVDYINEQWEYIDHVIKKSNPHNEIVYISLKKYNTVTSKVTSFVIDADEYIGMVFEMRHLFDSSPSLLSYCSDLLSPEKMLDNIAFDNRVNSSKAIYSYVRRCTKHNFGILARSITDTFSLKADEGIYLWGAGYFGQAITEYAQSNNIKILGIIDNNISQGEICGVKIISPDKIIPDSKIYISVYDASANEDIMEQIRQMGINVTCVRFQDLFEYNL